MYDEKIYPMILCNCFNWFQFFQKCQNNSIRPQLNILRILQDFSDSLDIRFVCPNTCRGQTNAGHCHMFPPSDKNFKIKKDRAIIPMYSCVTIPRCLSQDFRKLRPTSRKNRNHLGKPQVNRHICEQVHCHTNLELFQGHICETHQQDSLR